MHGRPIIFRGFLRCNLCPAWQPGSSVLDTTNSPTAMPGREGLCRVPVVQGSARAAANYDFQKKRNSSRGSGSCWFNIWPPEAARLYFEICTFAYRSPSPCIY